MAEPINIHDAKTQFSRLVARAEAGEEVVIARAGQPVARLVPARPRSEPRRPGIWKGRVRIAEDFDETPDWLIDAFEGGKGP